MALLNGGDRVSERLVVDRLLGEGAFAEVHRVRHEVLGWQAVKLFKRVASLEETSTMLGEARLLSTLGHPNIIRLFDAGTVRTPEGYRGYFTMEYVGGGSLGATMDGYRDGGAAPVDFAVEVMAQIAAGLAVAHEQSPPIVHRDITPANVLVGYTGTGLRLRVSDFGLAKSADPVTQLASAQGTYAYMAPEALRNEGYSRASDVWSVGTIAYQLLTNHFPYGDEWPFISYSLARFRRRLLRPSEYNDDVDAGLDDLVMSTLELDPVNRPATARALLDAVAGRREPVRRTGPSSVTSRTTTAGPPPARARRLADEALALARVPGELSHAADLMEEAVNLSPRLKELYMARLLLWRRGVIL